MEAFLIPFSLFGSVIAFNLIVLTALIIIFISEFTESGGFALCTVLVFLVFNFFWGNLEILNYLTLYNIGSYLFLGFIFSLIRTYFKGKEFKDEKRNKSDFWLKQHVFRWWFLFPFSAVNWVFGTLLRDLFNFAYSKVEGMYLKLFNL